MRGLLTGTLLFLLLFPGFGQKNEIKPEHLKYANELRDQFEEANAAAFQHRTTYQFNITDAGMLQILQKDRKEILALESNASHNEQIYFNSKEKVESATFRNSRGRKYQTNIWCGHYSSNGIFHSDAQLCNYEIYLPRKGEFVSMESEVLYLDPKYLTTSYFQSTIPTRSRNIEFLIPSAVEVEFIEFNFEGYIISKEESTSDGLRKVVFRAENLEAFEQGPHVPGYSHFMPHIMVLTKKYNWNEQDIDVLSSTNSLYKWYKSLVDLRKNDPAALKPLAESIVKDLDKDEDKLKAVYYWVQDNIKYIAFENGIAGFKPEDSDKVFANKYGDCKGMANLTAELLKLLGYDARLAWIGTDFLNYTYETPSLAVDNHMICAVKIEDEFLFLDATEKNNAFEDRAERIQGKQAMIENGDSYLIQEIPVEPIEKYLQETEVIYRLSGSGFKAQASETVKGEFKKQLINTYKYIHSEKSTVFYKAIAAGNYEIQNVSLINKPVLEREQPLELEYDVDLSNNFNQFGEEIYIDMDFKKDMEDRVIKKERKVPYKFESRINRKFRGKLSIPQGMKVSHMPSPLSLTSDYYEFKLQYQVSGNEIQYQKEIKILKSLLPTDEFEEWNQAVEQLKNFYNDQIILSKE